MRDQVVQLLEEKKFSQLGTLLRGENAPDIALLLQDLPKEDFLRVFRLLPKQLAAETFVEMDSDEQEFLIHAFSDLELRDVVEELFLDDTVDIIEEMPAGIVKRILRYTDPDTRKMINELLSYPEDSAGSIMTIEYVDLKMNMTVSQAFERIRKTGVDKETIYTCYVTDIDRKLLGLVSVRTLLLSSQSSIIGDIMETNVIYSTTLEDREDVANKFQKYDLMAIPVVDDEKRLVGIITIDDAMDVLQEEVTEDIEKMAAISPSDSDKPYLKTSTLELWKKRIPWLLFLMISATFTGMIISSFEDALATQVVLTAFIPMLMDTAGNSGSQTSVTIIRSLSLKEVEFSDLPIILWKEFRVSIMCGVTLALANFIKIILVDRVGILIAFVVCLTLIITICCAKLVGCILPMVSNKLGFDPAVMSSPFITTIVDAISLLIYFNVASIFLKL